MTHQAEGAGGVTRENLGAGSLGVRLEAVQGNLRLAGVACASGAGGSTAIGGSGADGVGAGGGPFFNDTNIALLEPVVEINLSPDTSRFRLR